MTPSVGEPVGTLRQHTGRFSGVLSFPDRATYVAWCKADRYQAIGFEEYGIFLEMPASERPAAGADLEAMASLVVDWIVDARNGERPPRFEEIVAALRAATLTNEAGAEPEPPKMVTVECSTHGRVVLGMDDYVTLGCPKCRADRLAAPGAATAP
jgi:hypothetical protein